jgi:hypothetical protein
MSLKSRGWAADLKICNGQVYELGFDTFMETNGLEMKERTEASNPSAMESKTQSLYHLQGVPDSG